VDSVNDGIGVGLEGSVQATVTPEMTAAHVGSGDVPVLATPMVLALAERAAVAALAGRLPMGSTTVGVSADVMHSAPTPVGATVTASARLETVEGRRLRFAFVLSDPGGEVAAGSHTRAIVDRESFEAGAAKRLGPESGPDGPAPRLVGVDHVNLLMPPGGEDAARAFYAGVLGLAEVPKPDPLAARGGCWFQSVGIDLHLSIDATFVPADRAHPGLLVADLDESASALRAGGAPVRGDDSVAGVHRLYTADPFGNRIELIQSGQGFRERRPGGTGLTPGRTPAS
jgi:predicted thioesterase/catechol 2,3-dioxygenase-like lactoylglutathione lyase family enzyme